MVNSGIDGSAVERISVIAGLDPASYVKHALHADSCVWVEKNCYIDLWIEILHALQLEPMAMMPFTLAVDFEGDQWTFFKPSHDEIRALYGIDVQELTVWRPLLDHAIEHLSAGKLISTEADAFWLPDTSATDYRRQHTKTTIVLCDLDLRAQRLGYFHNAGYFVLEGEDFIRLFRIGDPADPEFLPLFAELVRIDRMERASADRIRPLSKELLRKHYLRRPSSNPVQRFAARFDQDLRWLQEQGLAAYHSWAFGSIRQLGAAFELAARYLQWLADGPNGPRTEAEHAFAQLSQLNKTLILKAARAVNAQRPLDVQALFAEMGSCWDRGMSQLDAYLQG